MLIEENNIFESLDYHAWNPESEMIPADVPSISFEEDNSTDVISEEHKTS